MTLAAGPDAGPLIHLAEIDSLELLSAFDRLLVPETVYWEVGGVPDGVTDLSRELVEADESPVGVNAEQTGARRQRPMLRRRRVVDGTLE